MTVRKTELNIPRGYTAEDLGQVGEIISPAPISPNPDCYLISILTSPITKGSTNTYVVLVTEATLQSQVESYQWKVFEELTPGLSEVELDPSPDKGVFEYKPKNAVPIIVRVSLLDSSGADLRTLSIRQEVRSPYEALERLLNYSEIEVDDEILTYRTALGAHPDTSREVLNDLYPYINTVFESSTDPQKVPRDFLAAILYLQVFRVPKERTETLAFSNRFRNLELENVAALLNGESSWSFSTEIYNSLGVCQIAPETLAMIIQDPDFQTPTPERDYTTYTRWTELPHDEAKRSEVREQTRQNYLNLTPDTKAVQIDLYNLLRFQKSNIKLCFDLLNHLKNRPNRYPNLTTDELLNNAKAIQLIATEFEIGGTDALLEDAKPSAYGKDALKIMHSPLFTIGFGGQLELKVKGTVVDETYAEKSMEGARVDLYKTMLRNSTDNLKCFKSYDNISATTPESEYEKLSLDETLPVLEVKRSPSKYPDSDIVKVKKMSNKLSYNEGWVVARSGNQHYAKLESIRSDTVALVDSNNSFSFTVSEYQPNFIRIVKDPDENHIGYFDGELQEQIGDLTRGWFLPPKQDIRIEMKPAKYMIRESEIVTMLADWENYDYAPYPYTPRYPNGYYMKDLPYLDISEAGNPQIACNSFVEALLVELWHREYGNFYWTNSHHELAMIMDMDYPFSSVSVYYRDRIIDVVKNPDVGTQFTIEIDGTQVTVNAGDNVEETATNIEAALKSNATIAGKVTVWSKGIYFHKNQPDEELKAAYVAIRQKTVTEEFDYNISIIPDSGFNISPNIFPGIPVDIRNSNSFPPSWSVVQGWHSANSGHNILVVDSHPKTGKILTLESNSVNNQEGPGFRTMGVKSIDGKGISRNNESGDIDNHKVGNRIEPNKDFHWTEKVTSTWKGLKSYYNFRSDGENPLGIARLKIYDLRWAKPIL